jgi:hypothetical protein
MEQYSTDTMPRSMARGYIRAIRLSRALLILPYSIHRAHTSVPSAGFVLVPHLEFPLIVDHVPLFLVETHNVGISRAVVDFL